MEYCALAYYIFETLEEPDLEVRKHKKFFKERDVGGRIYISKEGINGQMSGATPDCDAYMDWLRSDPRFANVNFKIHKIKKNIFPRMIVKHRALVALGEKAEPAKGGDHVSPQQWREMIESGEEYLMLDVRNDYEWKIGHFEGAELPDLENFRDFPAYADHLKETKDLKKTKVMMYCTGGIRCELYSAVLKARGFENVYQLEGGIIKYGQEEGSRHWKGSLFVFDDRMAIPIDGGKVTPISHCCFCKIPTDTYYNCANMDCNELFLSCPECIEKELGCCSKECGSSPRRRLLVTEEGNRPFRKKHLVTLSE
ncbi:MAG: rhodanese-related sulfurtransferase [Chlamydiales bacterium]